MPIEIGETIVFSDECSIQECEALLGSLQADPEIAIDLRRCCSMHTALFQILIASGERPVWAPADHSLRELLGEQLSWTEPPAPSTTAARKGAARSSKERT